jgi:hypothetical protein
MISLKPRVREPLFKPDNWMVYSLDVTLCSLPVTLGYRLNVTEGVHRRAI